LARIPYPDPADEDVAPLMEQIRRDGKWGDRVPNVLQMVMHSPSAFRGWMEFFPAINRRSVLAARYRELTILRVAILNNSEYEFAAHIAPAKAAGLSDAEIELLRDTTVSEDLAPADRAVLMYTDEMTKTIKVSNSTFSLVRVHFNDREIVELTLTVGGYNLVSRFLEALQIDHDGQR
jgi:alkylhydroperoxidase family enzyme